MSFLVELPDDAYRARMPGGFVASAAFDAATARAMAWLAQLAYEQEPKIRAILDGWGLAWRAPLTGKADGVVPLTATRGFVAEGWGATLVVFAGTDPVEPANWLTNFNTLPTPDDMHAGFDAAVEIIWPALQAALAGRAAGTRLFFTGHSLGAAIAVLAARRAAASAGIDGVYAYGMPRCGGRTFADTYDAVLGERTYRFVNGHDVVPTVPPTRFGFRHVGRALICPHGQAFDFAAPLAATASDLPSFSQTFLDGIRSGLQNLLTGQLPPQAQPGMLGKVYRILPPGIGDHLPARYLRALGVSLDEADG
ncbi:MAG: lipase family protein [Alphaproteobacteria bacterium]|nr:lipase family protein [Alphaproteobacteria bacterium]